MIILNGNEEKLNNQMVDIRSTFEGHNCSQLAVAIAHGSCELPSNREYNSEEISYQSPMLQLQPLD